MCRPVRITTVEPYAPPGAADDCYISETHEEADLSNVDPNLVLLRSSSSSDRYAQQGETSDELSYIPENDKAGNMLARSVAGWRRGAKEGSVLLLSTSHVDPTSCSGASSLGPDVRSEKDEEGNKSGVGQRRPRICVKRAEGIERERKQDVSSSSTLTSFLSSPPSSTTHWLG